MLDLTKSTYCTPFNRLCKEVAGACNEANDNVKYLAALEGPLKAMSSCAEFPNLSERFRPVVHMIMLVWKHSKHYNTPARLVVLMREICNDLIEQARKFVCSEELFELDASEAVDRLMLTLKVCGTFLSLIHI